MPKNRLYPPLVWKIMQKLCVEGLVLRSAGVSRPEMLKSLHGNRTGRLPPAQRTAISRRSWVQTDTRKSGHATLAADRRAHVNGCARGSRPQQPEVAANKVPAFFVWGARVLCDGYRGRQTCHRRRHHPRAYARTWIHRRRRIRASLEASLHSP